MTDTITGQRAVPARFRQRYDEAFTEWRTWRPGSETIWAAPQGFDIAGLLRVPDQDESVLVVVTEVETGICVGLPLGLDGEHVADRLREVAAYLDRLVKAATPGPARTIPES